MPYSNTFIVYNYTPYELTLDTGLSNNLGNGDWPSSIAAGSASGPTVATVTQSGSTNLNPTAVYILQSSPAINATLHFFCDGVDPWVHVQMTLNYTSTPDFDSAIWEDNSNPSQSASGSNNLSLDKKHSDGAIQGTAKFVIGQSSIPS